MPFLILFARLEALHGVGDRVELFHRERLEAVALEEEVMESLLLEWVRSSEIQS